MTTGGREFLQQATHAELLQSVTAYASVPRGGPRPDAIVVPAARPARNLETAMNLARDAGCHLCLLCSRDADATDAGAWLTKLGLGPDSATVVTVPTGYGHELFQFGTTDWVREPGLPARVARDSDLSIKRNIGLALARMLGWQRIFFLDDDIREVTVDALTALTRLLGTGGPGGPYRTAGMTVREFPDNSVVCHARREVKKDQDVFVSGSVLAVDCTEPFGFFPDIYNEDWLFFYDDAAARRLASPGFNAQQLFYDPYANPDRAAHEEFGDIIAEGLYSLLHSGLGLQSATREYWRQFLDDRMQILNNIIGRLHIAPDEIQEEMTCAITTARAILTDIQPGMCVDYIRLWRQDLEKWEIRLEDLPRQDSIADALAELGLSPGDPTP